MHNEHDERISELFMYTLELYLWFVKPTIFHVNANVLRYARYLLLSKNEAIVYVNIYAYRLTNPICDMFSLSFCVIEAIVYHPSIYLLPKKMVFALYRRAVYSLYVPYKYNARLSFVDAHMICRRHHSSYIFKE